MSIIDVNDFTHETECIYEEERYSARDNGAVFRHQQNGKRVRPNDNQWTFGKENSANAYLHISKARIHRIIATAFHGEPPTPQYVVDHIDSNCRNNRPENLRWVTRLENALNNPITKKKIEYLCGSVEAFLENPSMLNALQLEPNFSWMRTVTPEEAKNCKERMSFWANTNKEPKGGSLGEWVYSSIQNREIFSKSYADLEALSKEETQNGKIRMYLTLNTNAQPKDRLACELFEESVKKEKMFGREPELVMSLTEGCAQYMWRVPSYFPCCPVEVGADPIHSYFQNLKIGAVFAYNDHYPESKILDFVMINNNSSILIMCERDSLKPWSVAEVTFDNKIFIHSNLGSYFDRDGADKKFCIKQGLEWTGGDTFDDFC